MPKKAIEALKHLFEPESIAVDRCIEFSREMGELDGGKTDQIRVSR